MVQLQIDLNEEENEIVEIYKIKNKLLTKENAVKKIIKNAKGCNHKFELVNKETDNFKTQIIQRCGNCGMIRTDNVRYTGEITTTFSKQ